MTYDIYGEQVVFDTYGLQQIFVLSDISAIFLRQSSLKIIKISVERNAIL